MRIHYLIVVAGLSAALAAPVAAQSVKSVGDDVHHTLKSAGNTVKADAKDVGSAAHHTLQEAGNGTKTELGNATGIHKVGGTVGQAARDVSHTGKKVARSTKRSVKKHTSRAHRELTKSGNEAKASVKTP